MHGTLPRTKHRTGPYFCPVVYNKTFNKDQKIQREGSGQQAGVKGMKIRVSQTQYRAIIRIRPCCQRLYLIT